MFGQATQNWTRLLAFTLRRDRLSLPLWIVAAVLLSAGFAPAFEQLATDQQEMAILYETMKSPAMVAMCGIVYGSEPTYGTLLAQFMLVWTALFIGIMNVFIVARHTRRDEEEGRTEVLRSLPVGRSANLFALTKTLFAANLLIAVLTGALLTAYGIDTITPGASFLYGAALGAIGLLFAGLAMLFAQLASTSKGATGLSLAALGVFYILRAAGDMQSEVLACISPLGLVERIEAYVNNEVWPVLVLILEAFVFIAVAFMLDAKRDFGQGFLPARRGHRHAPKTLSGEWGLALRLTRGTCIAWSIVVIVCSAGYGSVFNDLSAFYSGNDVFRALMGATGSNESDLMAPIISMLLLIMSLLGTVPVLGIVLKMRAEEKRGRLEQIFSKSVSRVRAMLAYLAIATVLAALLQLLNAFGMWSAAASVMDDPPALDFICKVAFSYLPAMLAFIGLGTLLVGLLPKLCNLVWVYLGATFFSVYIGSLLNVPDWALKLSPFGLTPRWPVEEYTLAPALGMSIAFLALSAAGIAAWRARSLDT
jgi:ABC-2 type transport system permease protein